MTTFRNQTSSFCTSNLHLSDIKNSDMLDESRKKLENKQSKTKSDEKCIRVQLLGVSLVAKYAKKKSKRPTLDAVAFKRCLDSSSHPTGNNMNVYT